MLRRKLSTCLMGAAVVITVPNGQASATPAPSPSALQSTSAVRPTAPKTAVSDRLQDRPGCNDRGSQNVWRYGEPELGDMLSDPIVTLLMKRDGVSREFLENLVRAAQCGMTGTS